MRDLVRGRTTVLADSIAQEAFKTRVRNAVARLNENQKEAMRNAIRSMPERLQAMVEAKGVMTEY